MRRRATFLIRFTELRRFATSSSVRIATTTVALHHYHGLSIRLAKVRLRHVLERRRFERFAPASVRLSTRRWLLILLPWILLLPWWVAYIVANDTTGPCGESACLWCTKIHRVPSSTCTATTATALLIRSTEFHRVQLRE